MVTEVPLANTSRGIACGLECVRNSGLTGVQADVGAWKEHGLAEHAPRVTAGHQSCARGGADRVGGVEGGEHAALAGHAVDVRGLDLLGAEAAEILVALVIGEDDNKIRGLGAVRCGRSCRRRMVN